ncbi:HsdR family type I site-specific deoxyribonuclease [Globicatella sulfidifaciens]|uniref:Type I restriction enzyme endonuclease subunit n=1 Tax=Globicatella sulfidifaciens TaxID=136093 RepID=A0A7X8C5S3_9LACT|nr:HsdR family type I site-specific deoxyribonuclease [Globicatella sulfidifaciens]NLJ19446.1 HsdR family type I site-specific deoxyribonuclease [Globicatella sulfidifaciens]
MTIVGNPEVVTQNRLVDLFQNRLNYTYLGNWHSRPNNRNIEPEYVAQYLQKAGYRQELITRAISQLQEAAMNQADDLYDNNKYFYTLLRYGVKVKEHVGKDTETIHVINWSEPYENDFYIVEEVSIEGEHKKRPDLVIYVNGIALGVIELKRSTVSISEGIRQNLDNQEARFIRPFFNTMQLVMAGNDSQGLRYGTIETIEKYYLTWKEDPTVDDMVTERVLDLHKQESLQLDKDVISLCQKERFLRLIHDFIVYDHGIKKVARPNQYFGVVASTDRVKRREGGIIWHTQGSGKSLTMVWLTKWIREHIPDSRVLIITDREELDSQIETVFLGVEENIYRTKSGKDLIEKLNHHTPSLMGSLIHKFGRTSQSDDKAYDSFIEEIKENLPRGFEAKGDIYVFVDEAHRTQSGKLHEAMKAILPNAMFIGFTGTPLLKKDKAKSIEVFGSYIHTYKFDEAVDDGVVLDLQYEARHIEQDLSSEEKIDEWFALKTKGLTDYAKGRLKKRWGTLQKVLSSRSRLDKIVNDIILDMERYDRLRSGRGNAMLVAGGIYEACKYYELFQQRGFKECAIITSYIPNINDIKGETTGQGDTEAIEKYNIYTEMLNGQSPEDFEKEVKRKFIHEPARMKLLIVVDKLLTGFDAPPATYLYIDKSMQDHALFQAICRVNRLDGEDKEYGYIVDYMDLFNSLEKSITDYTSNAFDNFDKEDVTGLLKDRLKVAKERLDSALDRVKALCEPVAPPKGMTDYFAYFSSTDTSNPEVLKQNEQKRLTLYQYVASLTRNYTLIANDMLEAGYTAEEIQTIQKDVAHYEAVRQEVMHNAGDYIDLKSYEANMRHLIDSYIGAKESEKISAFEDLTLIDLIVNRGKDAVEELPVSIKKDEGAVAETIENNVRRVIIEEMPTNPKYYEKMSVLLDEIIKRRKEAADDYEAYLNEITQLAKEVNNPGESADYPEEINSGGKQALYDNLDQDESLALALHEDLMQTKPDGWRGNRIKERKVLFAIKRHVKDNEKTQEIFKIIEEQGEY